MPLTKAVRRRFNRQTQYCGRRLEPAAIGGDRRRLEHPTVDAVSAVKHLELTGDAVAVAKPVVSRDCRIHLRIDYSL